MEKVIGKSRFPTGDSQLNIHVNSNYFMAHAHITPTDPSRLRNDTVLNSVTQIPNLREKTTHGEFQGKTQPLCRKAPKAKQQVSAFGPAHAEQARKLYQLKGFRYKQRHKNRLGKPRRGNIHNGSEIMLSQHEQTQVGRNGDQLPEDPKYRGRRVQHETSCKKEVPLVDMIEQNQPILKLVKISSRPNKYTKKQINTSNVEHWECAGEHFLEKKPLGYKKRVRGKYVTSLTLLQILENRSSYNYTRHISLDRIPNSFPLSI